jgi:hypothetical protein
MGKDESQEDFLIWFISFGEQNNKEMTFFSILSILHYTNYKGDIIVLSDQDQFTTPIDRVKFINVKDKYPLNNKFNIYCIKPKITDFIDITKYKYCLYMDSDILVNEPKFQELLYSWSESNKIMVIDNEGWKVHRNVASTGRNSLTEEEKEKYKDFEVCAGLFGVPGNEVGLNFLKLWDDINSLDYNADDQGNLYALLLRNPIDYFYLHKKKMEGYYTTNSVYLGLKLDFGFYGTLIFLFLYTFYTNFLFRKIISGKDVTLYTVFWFYLSFDFWASSNFDSSYSSGFLGGLIMVYLFKSIFVISSN